MLAIQINYYNRATRLSITTWCYIDEKVHFVGCPRSFVRLLHWESGTYSPGSGYGSNNLRKPISVYRVFGDCDFLAACPGCWNNLPHDRRIRLAVSVNSFKAQLETYLFAKAYSLGCPLLVRG